MTADRAIIITAVFAGALTGAMVGAWTADAIHSRHFNHPAWANLGPVYIGLFGALFSLAALELGRWTASIRLDRERAPIGWDWPITMIMGLARIGTALIGMSLGFEVGRWTAHLFWSIWGSSVESAPEPPFDFVDVWAGAELVCGGALALLGLRLGRSLPPVAGFVGAYLGLQAASYVSPAVADLYWGPYPRSDHVMFVAMMAALLTTSLLVLTCAFIGYRSSQSMQRRWPLLRAGDGPGQR